MSDLFFSKIQQFTLEQVLECDDLVFNVSGTEKKEKLWHQLHELLLPLSIEQLNSYRRTYIKWYAELSWWTLFYSLPKRDVIRVIEISFIAAVKNDVPVWEKVVTYLQMNTLDENDMQSVYNTIRETLLHSKQVVCVVRGQELTLEGFFDSLLRYEEVEDGLELAQFLADVVAGMSTDITEMNYVTDPAKAVDVLRDFAHFLSGVKPNRIFVVVDAYMYPQKYERLKVDASGEGAEIVEPEDDVEAMVPVSPPVTENTSAPEEDFNVFAYINDAAGTDLVQEVETSKVISLLQTLATEKGNPRIADVYFFNEQTGAFAWDEALLRELKLIPEDFDMSAVDVDKKDTSE